MTGNKLLVLDGAYTLEGVRRRGLEHSITVRDLGGFFEHVWNVHPLVGADPTEGGSVGALRSERFTDRHTFVEAHVGRFRSLRRLRILNLLISQLSLLWYLVRLVRRERISAIRVGDPYYLGIIGWFLARVGRMPLIVRVNGNYDAIYAATGQLAYPRLIRSRRIEKWMDRFVLQRADLVLAPNRDNLGYALANRAREDRSHVVAFGGLVDPCHFTEPAGRGSVRDELQIGSVTFLISLGRLEPVKYPQDVLDAFLLVAAGSPGLHLVMIGDGRLRGSLAARAMNEGKAEFVHLVGNRSQEWIACALVDAAVVVAPMAGRALVEASLSRTPIVAYDVEWHPELIESGRTGMLVPFRDVSALANAIIDLLADPDRAAAIGGSAREVALGTMAPEAITDQERSLYEGLLAGSRTSGPTAS